jgi:hypothetical protein
MRSHLQTGDERRIPMLHRTSDALGIPGTPVAARHA